MTTALTPDTFRILPPNSPEQAARRKSAMRDLWKTYRPGQPIEMFRRDLQERLQIEMQRPRPQFEGTDIVQNSLGSLRATDGIPDTTKAILDSTGGGTSGGSVLIRQDLEPLLHLLFVTEFPGWERLQKIPANGLVHAFNQITAPSGNSLFGTVLATELGTVNYAASTFARKTAPVAVFATGRGVSFKEIAAVRAGGASYDVLGTELADGMINLATDAQAMLFQGNATNASGAATNEQGTYQTYFFDGLRGVLGSAGSFAGNSAIQLDWGSLSYLEAIQNVAAQAGNNGGKPSLFMCSLNFKQALDSELAANRRYTDNTVEIIPGVVANRLQWSGGQLDIIPVPGTMIGSYNRTSDNVIVEDGYVLDERKNKIVWLYSEGWTVLEIPAGVDSQLSSRYIVFGMYGLEQAAPLFNGKVRRVLA